jgi:hypothetical protein
MAWESQSDAKNLCMEKQNEQLTTQYSFVRDRVNVLQFEAIVVFCLITYFIDISPRDGL